MASSIPRTRRKEIADAYVTKTLKVALFVNLTGYDPLTATTYTALAATATEVSSSGTGYTTGGYVLAGKAAANLATNGAIVTASPTQVANATFTCRYGVIYCDDTTKKIEAVSDFLTDYTVTSGTLTITWDNTNGILNIA
jgi:hypothetical protein